MWQKKRKQHVTWTGLQGLCAQLLYCVNIRCQDGWRELQSQFLFEIQGSTEGEKKAHLYIIGESYTQL